MVAKGGWKAFFQIKHDLASLNMPFCLDQAGIGPDDISAVVFYEKPFLKFERILETYLAFAPRGFASFSKSLPLWVKEKLFQKHILANALSEVCGDGYDWKEKMLFSEHHLSHAASAFTLRPLRTLPY